MLNFSIRAAHLATVLQDFYQDSWDETSKLMFFNSAHSLAVNVTVELYESAQASNSKSICLNEAAALSIGVDKWDAGRAGASLSEAPVRPTQPSIPPGSVNEYQLQLRRQSSFR